MIVVDDDSSDDDAFKALPTLLRAVARPSGVRARRDATTTRRASDDERNARGERSCLREFKLDARRAGLTSDGATRDRRRRRRRSDER